VCSSNKERGRKTSITTRWIWNVKYKTTIKKTIMAKYYAVTVAVEVEDAKGKIKKQREQYLVDALSVTEAEAKLVQKFVDEAVQLEYEVVKVSDTKILEVF
jgi:hypothetical protein